MASKKRPSWQFYPGDWMKDPGLRSVSSGARGIWIDMLCLMFECDRKGFLLVNGKPASLEMIARMTGNSTDDASRYLTELETSGVFSRTSHGIDGDGCIFSRRMVRDEANKKAWANNGKNGGNPNLKKRGDLVGNLDNPDPNQNGQGGVNQNCRSSTSVSFSLSRAPDEIVNAPPVDIPENLIELARPIIGLTPEGILKGWLTVNGWPANWILLALTRTAEQGKRGKHAVNNTRVILEEWSKNGGPESDKVEWAGLAKGAKTSPPSPQPKACSNLDAMARAIGVDPNGL